MKISLTNPSVFGVKTQKFPPAAAKFCPKTKFKEPKITKFWKSALRHTAGGIDAERKLTFLCPYRKNLGLLGLGQGLPFVITEKMCGGDSVQ